MILRFVLAGVVFLLPGFVLAQEAPAETGSEIPKTQPTSKAPAGKVVKKLYRFKGEKKTGSGDAQTMMLQVQDLLSGKSESLSVASNVAAAVKELAPGTPIEVQLERQRGRQVVVSIEKAPIAPGEDMPNMYVLVDWDKQKQADGRPIMAVKLRKLGREFTAVVPLVKNKETDDWAAPWGVEHALGKVQPGQVLEAVIKPGNPPVIKDMMLYRPPEQGKFIEFTPVEMPSGATAAGFKMLASDGVTVTVTLPGVEKMQGTTKVLMPDANQLRAVQRIKPDSEIEITLQPGDQYILRDIRVISPPAAK